MRIDIERHTVLRKTEWIQTTFCIVESLLNFVSNMRDGFELEDSRTIHNLDTFVRWIGIHFGNHRIANHPVDVGALLRDLTRLLRALDGDKPLARTDLAGRISRTIDDLRRIIDTAVPTLLDLFGFVHAVRVHLERAVGDEAITIEINDETDGAADELEPTVRTALYRIAQEAINNAVRHSGASSIEVKIQELEPDGLVMTVRDNGRGIPETLQRQSGLDHIRTRARLISAGLDISNEYGCALRVTLERRA